MSVTNQYSAEAHGDRVRAALEFKAQPKGTRCESCDYTEGWEEGFKAAKAQAPAPAPDHVPVSPEHAAKIDAAVGLVLLPPIRVDTETYAVIEKLSKANGMIVQATVRDMICGACHATGETPAPAPGAVDRPACNPHPKAPHGFNRNGSHNAGRHVCDCEGWDAWDAGYEVGLRAGLNADESPSPAVGADDEQDAARYRHWRDNAEVICAILRYESPVWIDAYLAQALAERDAAHPPVQNKE